MNNPHNITSLSEKDKIINEEEIENLKIENEKLLTFDNNEINVDDDDEFNDSIKIYDMENKEENVSTKGSCNDDGNNNNNINNNNNVIKNNNNSNYYNNNINNNINNNNNYNNNNNNNNNNSNNNNKLINKQTIFIIKKVRKKKNKLLLLKNKKILNNSYKNNNNNNNKQILIKRKNDPDSIRRKIKPYFHKYLLEILNSKIKKKFFYKKKLKKFLKFNNKLTSTVSIQLNKKLVDRKIYNILLKEPISSKYKSYDIENNKKLVMYLLSLKDKEIDKILKSSYSEIYSQYLNSPAYQFLLKKIKIKDGENYMRKFYEISQNFICYFLFKHPKFEKNSKNWKKNKKICDNNSENNENNNINYNNNRRKNKNFNDEELNNNNNENETNTNSKIDENYMEDDFVFQYDLNSFNNNINNINNSNSNNFISTNFTIENSFNKLNNLNYNNMFDKSIYYNNNNLNY
jgi:hypothetical protein